MRFLATVAQRSTAPAENHKADARARGIIRDREVQPTPRLDWSFGTLALDNTSHVVPVSPLSAVAIQRKLVVNRAGDRYEQEADRIAEQVMRMPEPNGVTALAGTDGPPNVQRKCATCEEEDKLQRKTAGLYSSEPAFAPPIVHEVLNSPGEPLDARTQAFFEPRFGFDFRRVRVHTSEKAGQSAHAVNALAYTVGQDMVFGLGQYRPQTFVGRRLVAHELAHTVQQTGAVAQRLQRTQQVTLNVRGRPPMTVVIGELRFTKDAIDDVLKFGALLPSADQAHIGFKGDQLGYDPNYTDPTDPYRWNKLKEIIDSDAKILVRKVDLMGQIKVLFITPKSRVVIDDNLRSLGLTLPTEALHKRISPADTTMTVSPSADTHHVLYTTALGSPADSSMAHELFGHMWLALKGVPWQHPTRPADIAARGTLTAAHGIRDPFGNIYTGTVQDYIDRYAGSERGMLASPTQNVGPQLLQNAVTAFKADFSKTATGTLNGSWKVSPGANSQWEIISSNYALAPQPATQSPAPTGPKAPVVSPAPKPTSTQAATPTTTPSATQVPATAPATVPAITQSSIEQDLKAWYGTLNADKQYVYIKFLESVQADFQRRTQLASQLLKSLSRPSGMAPSPSAVP